MKHRLLLSAAILGALSLGAQARDLGNYDVNSATRKAAATTGAARGTAVDAIGRETFTWTQQALPASAKAAALDAEGAARAHLDALLSRAKLATAAATSLADARVDAQDNGATLVHFRPRLDGIAIFHEDVALLLDRERALIAMRGPLPRNAAGSEKALAPFALDAADAVAAALRAYDFDAGVVRRLTSEKAQGEYARFRLAATHKSGSGAVVHGVQRAKPVWFRTRAGLQPAWYVETRVADAPQRAADAYGQVVSAIDGSVLFRMNQVAHATAFTYRVFAEDAPDFQPAPSPLGRNNWPDPDGLPSNNSAVPYITQSLRTLANRPFSRAATDAWLPDGASVTSGNNVVAYADTLEPDGFGAGDVQPSTTAPNTFDLPFDTALLPNASVAQTSAATLQMFFWTNWLHDFFYDNGFTETDGNAQFDNYGRGGQGGDPLLAEAQDYDVVNNANMATPADGGSPVMQMGLGLGNLTDRTLDGRTISHEWGHYISNRLVGDANGLFTEHAGGLGEGWGDIIALIANVKDEDRLKPTNASFAGAYGGGYSAHTFYGVRRYPYSTDLGKNPISARHLVDGTPLPTSPAPRFGADGSDNSEVHNQGEIWAAALWDAYASMLNASPRLSFTEAQRRMKNYLVGGLKLTPVAPTITEARDAVLATILAAGANDDFALFTAAFAKRGLGAGAFVPDRYSDSMAGTQESTQQGSDIAFASASLSVPTGCDADAVLDIGERATLTLTVSNAGFAALGGASATLSSSHPALTFPQGATVAIGDVPLFGSATISVPVELSSSIASNTPVAVTITPTASGINSPPGNAGTITTFVNFDQSPRSSAIESFDGVSTEWQNARGPEGTGPGAWVLQGGATAKVLHGEDTNSRALTWIQSPPMSVGGAPATVTLRHRFSFEADSTTMYDGGVIQTSIDGGATWVDLDPVVAGYGAAVLSDCCDNPFAGKRAFVDQSPGYPQFSDHVIDLGTTFANQSNFRLRFGIATDAAVVRNGWDIDSVAVSGLNDTPFAGVVAQASSCAAASYKKLQGAMGGTYTSAARNGEGVLVDFGQVSGSPVVFFSWYTYDGGGQQWLVGSAPFDADDSSVVLDLISTAGTGFGNAFQASEVVNTPWGSASLSFPTCDTMLLTYQKAGGEAGTLTLERGLQRLATGQCSTLHGGLGGTFYSPTRAGEGVLVDVGQVGGQPVEFFAWYTYEGGEQQWLVGSQPFSAGSGGALDIDLVRTQGARFGNAFRPQDVQEQAWGKVTQRFNGCDTLEIGYQKLGGETGTLVLERGLEKLGDGVCR